MSIFIISAVLAGMAQQMANDDVAPCTSGTDACVAKEGLPGPFILFFDWDGRRLDRDAEELLGQIVEAANANPELRIKLVGHSDRSGSASVNEVIARQRAEAVRQELVERGLKRDALSIRSAGERELLIQTADGVREAQNRRVEVEFLARN
ncbi:OmpA family protein [Sphingomicrobium nitratireducens]|uniref:OmpA family protein n=1 Tax=Sphingomicrobium nitratireducens TaxID=2964666 RepID=UPI00224092B2|nr:OmpA family protein [Sphingomicrobium nitratireducens]